MPRQALRFGILMLLLGRIGASGATEAQITAQLMLSLLVSGETPAAAELFHYPPSYTAAERARDVVEVKTALDLLIEELGAVRTPRLAPAAGAIVDVGVGGGTVPYWQSLPNLGRDESILYAVVFAKEGSGYIHIHFLRGAGGLQVQSLSFGLPAARAGAAGRIRAILSRLATELGRLGTRPQSRGGQAGTSDGGFG